VLLLLWMLAALLLLKLPHCLLHFLQLVLQRVHACLCCSLLHPRLLSNLQMHSSVLGGTH
jgi:hypothetical protein